MRKMSTAINIEQLEYFYRHQWTGKKIRALHPFSLQVEQGECFGFLGHNGAGKTTTIKALLGLIRAAKGRVKLFGEDSRSTRSRVAVGYVPEQPYFYDHLTVQEILSMYAGLSQVSSRDRKRCVEAALERLGLTDRRNAPMRSLSKGLTQRVAVAQAICHNPRLLILDEPFSGLDPLGRKELRDLFVGFRNSGTTIFMSSHILGDVEFLCGRVSIMVKGELKGVFKLAERNAESADGYELSFRVTPTLTPEVRNALGGQIISEGQLLRIKFIRRSDAEAALKRGLEKNLTLESFEASHQSLEELFVALTTKSNSSGQQT